MPHDGRKLRSVSNASVVQPALLGRINERQVLRAIQALGPLSRAEVARHAGMSAPTASKAVESLLRAGLLEEVEGPEIAGPSKANGIPTSALPAGRGRPARKLRLASRTAQVLGLVIDAAECRLVSAGLDGRLHEDASPAFATPDSYAALIESAASHAKRRIERSGINTLGLGISMPGLIDYRQSRGALSPNVPITDGQTPGIDLAARLGIECVLVQETHALCLAERYYGEARGIDDFAMLDVATGVGLGVMSGGRMLTGHSGLAGEIGHITVQPDGRLCGCGNTGCLETLACDSALAREVSERLGRNLSIEDVIALGRSGEPALSEELGTIVRYLGIGLAAVINLFNPSHLFVHGRLFAVDESLFERVVEETRGRTLAPAFADCRIVQARGSKRQGAVAAIIEHLTNAVVPLLPSDLYLPAAAHGNGKHV
jgi:N-acetylglucosamine repressor